MFRNTTVGFRQQVRSFSSVASTYRRFLSVQEKIGKIGAAWRIAEEREKERKKAIKRAERLGLTIQGDFDVAAGTAGINSEKSGAGRNKTPNMVSPKDNKKKSAKPESLDSDAYGQELAAMAMGADFSAVQGPGKVMSMGTSSYLADMVSYGVPDVTGDLCTVALYNCCKRLFQQFPLVYMCLLCVFFTCTLLAPVLGCVRL